MKHKGIVIKEIEKIKFLREMCKEERPYFLAFAETWLNDKMKEAEYEIEGYSHVASHRKNREGGGTIVYIDNGATYKPLVSVSDKMCSIVAVHLEELNLIVFMVYRPPPNNKDKGNGKDIYHGDKLERSFDDIVLSNINKVISKFQAPTPDIILAGDFNFPKALWDAGIGTVQTDIPCNRKSLQKLIDVASRYNLLQTVTEGTRVTRSGRRNILELIFTNNHELITSVQVEPSEITDHEYIKCETSYKLSAMGKEHVHDNGTNLSTYNYESANWKNIKAELKKINWPEILAEHESSEEKLKVILEIVIKIIEENCTTFRNQRGSHSNKIPRDRRVLFKKRKILNKELQKRNPPDKKKRIEKAIGEIDKKLLDSYEEENIVNETRAIEYIKSNPKYFFTYARKKLKTRKKIGPFDMGGEKITSLLEICIKLVEQYSSGFSQPDPK